MRPLHEVRNPWTRRRVDRSIPDAQPTRGCGPSIKHQMAVVIRLKRTGRRNRPCYRISVADSRFPRDGRTLENLGLYDPICADREKQATLKVDRARHWLGHGALPSETVRSLFKRFGVYEGEYAPVQKKRDRSGRKKVTNTRTRKHGAKKARTEAKATRRTERKLAKKAVAAPAE